jgi:hypothetical protein
MIVQSNNLLAEAIKTNNPFIVARVSDNCTKLSLYGNDNYRAGSALYDGIYFSKSPDLEESCEGVVELYRDTYNESFKNSDYLASFNGLAKREEDTYMDRFPHLKKLFYYALEPYYICLENERPWSLDLYGKRVLIINPFIGSFQKQLNAGFKIFEDKDIFHPQQEFVFYKPYQTTMRNHLHSSWAETYELMKDDIRNIEFDIALLGCGGYGMPLCNFIKAELQKSAVYVGGSLQLLFGVKGKRWVKMKTIGDIIRENGNFIYPSGDECPPNYQNLEGGCYWE